ncbi:hypothetical protein HK100_004831 [Physocladia obscura]|uniref:Heterokaryon incompatibility domain-containing protein n=1 Tax=Physocladia obscura TaxID=109957 RepID=A0AAD5SXZ7_9FUNG|nr:hypothetical protein HK100_004831 [Physocladia obscura]
MVLIEGIPWEWFLKRWEEHEHIPSYSGKRYCKKGYEILIKDEAYNLGMSAQYLEKRIHETEVYACISHVWGEDHMPTTLSNVTRDDQPCKISLNSNEAKHWFVNKIAHVDAEVPTWFDTYSMPQTPDSEVSRNMALMHQIYTNADICYILIEDDNFHDHLSKYLGASMVRSHNDAMNGARSITSILDKSMYRKRVWTLQEELLPIAIVYVACCKDKHSLPTLGLGGIYEHEFKDSKFKNIVTTKIDDIFESIHDESWLKYIHERCSLSYLFRSRTGSTLDIKQKPDREVKLDDFERSRIWREHVRDISRHCTKLRDYVFGYVHVLDLSLGIEYERDSIEIMQAWVTALVKEGLIRWGMPNGLAEVFRRDNIKKHLVSTRSQHGIKQLYDIGYYKQTDYSTRVLIKRTIAGEAYMMSNVVGNWFKYIYVQSESTDSVPRPNDDYLGKIWASRKYVWPEIPVNTEIEMTELASNSDYDQLLDEHLVLFIVSNDWTYSGSGMGKYVNERLMFESMWRKYHFSRIYSCGTVCVGLIKDGDAVEKNDLTFTCASVISPLDDGSEDGMVYLLAKARGQMHKDRWMVGYQVADGSVIEDHLNKLHQSKDAQEAIYTLTIDERCIKDYVNVDDNDEKDCATLKHVSPPEISSVYTEYEEIEDTKYKTSCEEMNKMGFTKFNDNYFTKI